MELSERKPTRGIEKSYNSVRAGHRPKKDLILMIIEHMNRTLLTDSLGIKEFKRYEGLAKQGKFDCLPDYVITRREQETDIVCVKDYFDMVWGLYGLFSDLTQRPSSKKTL